MLSSENRIYEYLEGLSEEEKSVAYRYLSSKGFRAEDWEDPIGDITPYPEPSRSISGEGVEGGGEDPQEVCIVQQHRDLLAGESLPQPAFTRRISSWELPGSVEDFRVGGPARIIRGPYTGVEGIITGISNGNVILESFGERNRGMTFGVPYMFLRAEVSPEVMEEIRVRGFRDPIA